MPACHTGNLYTCHSVFQYPCKIVYNVDKGLIALFTASSPTPSAHEMMNEKVLPHFPGENIEVQKLYNLLDQKTLAQHWDGLSIAQPLELLTSMQTEGKKKKETWHI